MLEQFQNQILKNRKNRGKLAAPLAPVYMTAHCPGLVQAQAP